MVAAFMSDVKFFTGPFNQIIVTRQILFQELGWWFDHTIVFLIQVFDKNLRMMWSLKLAQKSFRESQNWGPQNLSPSYDTYRLCLIPWCKPKQWVHFTLKTIHSNLSIIWRLPELSEKHFFLFLLVHQAWGFFSFEKLFERFLFRS